MRLSRHIQNIEALARQQGAKGCRFFGRVVIFFIAINLVLCMLSACEACCYSRQTLRSTNKCRPS